MFDRTLGKMKILIRGKIEMNQLYLGIRDENKYHVNLWLCSSAHGISYVLWISNEIDLKYPQKSFILGEKETSVSEFQIFMSQSVINL
jgi:hypothetical protein